LNSHAFIATLIPLAMPIAGFAATPQAPPGAMACTGCHPTALSVDTPVVRLSDLSPSQIVSAMQAFRSGQRSATVMDRIAKGFSDEEVRAIAAWFDAQR
jgi:cytochrome subunit of sulfide dehydrogenase